MKPESLHSSVPCVSILEIELQETPDQSLEDLFDMQIHKHGHLAIAWTPFNITVDSDLYDCGLSALTIANMGGADALERRVVTAMDN